MAKWQWTEEQRYYFALPLEEKAVWFWSLVDCSAGPGACWEWQGKRDRRGYGVFYACLGETKAFRIAYRLTKGDIETGKVILHSCDNPPCCNPNHLSQGTHLENMLDKITKGRQWRGGPYKKEPQ